jgi:hypothetical protein
MRRDRVRKIIIVVIISVKVGKIVRNLIKHDTEKAYGKVEALLSTPPPPRACWERTPGPVWMLCKTF